MKKHFLNNIFFQLNCISRIAAMENATQTQKLVKGVMDNMRYKVGREGQIIKVKEEMIAIDNMIELFKMRFGNAFEYKVTMDESIVDFYIPHFTIAAFVENSIYHAFEDKEEPWRITILFENEEGMLTITIKDNGIGFDVTSYMLTTDGNNDYGSIKSTILRLKEYFKDTNMIMDKSTDTDTDKHKDKIKDKDNNMVNIQSSRGNGTTVTINIPLH